MPRTWELMERQRTMRAAYGDNWEEGSDRITDEDDPTDDDGLGNEDGDEDDEESEESEDSYYRWRRERPLRTRGRYGEESMSADPDEVDSEADPEDEDGSDSGVEDDSELEVVNPNQERNGDQGETVPQPHDENGTRSSSANTSSSDEIEVMPRPNLHIDDGGDNAFGDILPPMRPAAPAGPSHRRRFDLEQILNPARSHRTSDTNQSAPASTAGSSSRAPSAANQRGGQSGPIDLTGTDSEDELVVTGANIRSRAPPQQARGEGSRHRLAQQPHGDHQAGRRGGGDEFGRALADIDHALSRAARDTTALMRADAQDDRRREIMSPAGQRDQRPRGARNEQPVQAAEPGARRIGLGGAVLRNGNRQIQYDGARRRIRLPLVDSDEEWLEDEQELQGAQPTGGIAADYMMRIRALRDRYMHLEAPAGFGAAWPGLNLGAIMNAGLGGLHYLGGGGPGGAGPAGNALDPEHIISKVKFPKYPTPKPTAHQRFTVDFALDSANPITIDDDGRVVKQKKKFVKPFLACISCQGPLLLSSGYKDESAKVWVLRCGHSIHQKCLHTLSTPTTSQEVKSAVSIPNGGIAVLGAPERKKKKGRYSGRSEQAERTEYTWRCPVEGCGEPHRSEKKISGGEWVQKEDEGAFPVYM